MNSSNMISGQRSDGQPIIIEKGGEGRALIPERFFFQPLSDEFNERWLQDLLRWHPHILPIGKIDESFAPLIPIGREVSVDSGSIDNLFINPAGKITIVETKLWKNPEQRRQVVGQVMDYAKDLSRWTYEDLDESVVSFYQNPNYQRQPSDKHLFQSLIDHLPGKTDFNETEFANQTIRNLQQGRFLLLVVGDGITEGAADLIEHVARMPQLLFTLSMIELQTYHLEDKILLIPQVLLRTKEIVRAVLEMKGVDPSKVSITVPVDSGGHGSFARNTLTEQDFYDVLRGKTKSEAMVELSRRIVNDADKLGCKVEWRTGRFDVVFRNSEGIGSLLFGVNASGIVSAQKNYLFEGLKAYGITGTPKELVENYVHEIGNLMAVKIDLERGRIFEFRLDDLTPKYEAFFAIVKQIIDRIKRSI